MSSKIKTITFQESERLLSFLEQSNGLHTAYRESIRNYAMAVCMLDAGLRVGEVCNMLICDLFWKNEPVKSIIVTAQISKNKTERQIPVSVRLCEALKKMSFHWWTRFGIDDTRYAFCRNCGDQQLSTRQVERVIKNAGKIALHKVVTPHTLRHTFATRLAKKVNIRVVQELLGHKSITSTQIYTHPDSDDLEEAINHLNDSAC